MNTPLLQLQKAVKHYHGNYGVVQALDGVDMYIQRGETLGLVGESGCGKSTVARVVMRLIALSAGSIMFDGADITHQHGRALDPLRRRLQMVFQDPFSSLNPRVSIGRAIEEPLIVQKRGNAIERREKVHWVLNRVGLHPDMAARYPHEFSGGQRQRIGIARALISQPELIVCDEAVSSLDVTMRAQILHLLQDLRQELGVAYLFISHDLSVVRHVADRVAVMYLGRVVEQGTRESLWRTPQHPYTQALISAIPSHRPGQQRKRIVLRGDVPSPINSPGGCHFHPRCPKATERCRTEQPMLQANAQGAHAVACHFGGI